MNSIQNRINAFKKLGDFLSQFTLTSIEKKDGVENNELFFDGFKHQLKLAEEHNAWFTKNNMLFAIESWSNALTESNLIDWLSTENIPTSSTKSVAIVMAGNIPLVGFHDFLSVLICGHTAIIKQSSNDRHLLPFLVKYIESIAPFFKGKILFTENTLENFDAVIATGSSNTARYFEYYFRNKPSIIRKNRNSVAVITGQETTADFENLATDIFTFFGLGCRSVSKIFVPKGYNFDSFFEGMFVQKEIINNVKYINNYDYNKAVYLMSEFDLLENGFLILKEDESYSSPIASIFYEYYDTAEQLKNKLKNDQDKIQCIVSKDFIDSEVPFGQTQHPKLWEYADGINTLQFLSSI